MEKLSVYKISSFLLCLIFTNCQTMKDDEKEINPPVAKIIPHETTVHGVKLTDNYFWLNDRDDKEVIGYLKSENAYSNNYFKKHKTLNDSILSEIKSRVLKDDESVPYPMNGYMYYSKYKGDNEHAFYYRKSLVEGSKEELLLDVNELAKGKSYCEEGDLEISPDNKILAYSADFLGRRKYSIYFKTLVDDKLKNDVIDNTSGSIVWANDNKTIFYAVEDEKTLRSYRIMKHVIGDSPKNDICVFEEKDETFYVDVERSRSGNYIFIHSVSTTTSECLYIKASEPESSFIVFEPRKRDHEYIVEEANNVFYIRTNLNAKNFKICTAKAGKTGSTYWNDLVPYDETELTEEFEAFKNFIVVESRKKGLVRLKVISISTNEVSYLDMKEEDYTVGIGTNEEYNTDVLRYYFGSLKTPICEFDYDLKSKTQVLLKQQKLNVPYNPNEYITKRIYAKALDGKEVPISIVYKQSLYNPGQNPCLVYGYGSYGVIIDPYFSGSRLSLLDRGFVFAIVHTRGGEDLGRDWYEDGKLLNKKNTFTDFIAASKFLIEQKYAHEKKVFAQGGSAGGLLMGAVVNMEPTLYKGILAEVPFVDVINTMMDSSIPLTTGEYDEWGDPNEKPYFDYMLSYSPYDNVNKTAYPAMFISTGLHDSQVQYWEPAKWVAKLRVYNTSKNPLLLHVNMDAGHGGASGRFEGLKEVALNYTFILTNL
jgi:oligopeptidase B